MQNTKLVYDNGFYGYCGGTSSEMDVLGIFLSNIGCSKKGRSIFQDWAVADKNDPHSGFTHTCGTNAIALEEDDNGKIHLVDDTGNDPDDIYYIPARIIMTRKQFVTLLDDWQEKVCKNRPKEVIIKHVDDQFIIDIKQ